MNILFTYDISNGRTYACRHDDFDHFGHDEKILHVFVDFVSVESAVMPELRFREGDERRGSTPSRVRKDGEWLVDWKVINK